MSKLYATKGDTHMNTISMPRWLHGLFGEEITTLALCLTLLFGVAVSAFLLLTTYNEWDTIPLWRQVALAVLAFDIAGGVVGNLSYSTNRYYKERSRTRVTTILYHVHPVVLALLLGNSYPVAIAVTIYTIAAALATNVVIDHRAQPIIGASLMLSGVVVLLLTFQSVPVILLALFALYMFKQIFGFAVDHYARVEAL